MESEIESDPHDARLRAISATLVAARKAAAALPGFPGALPATFDDAYRVQQLSSDAWDDAIAGWKVGGVPAPFVERFQQEWLVGPIFARNVVTARPDRRASMPVFKGGFAAIEPEFILQTGATRAQDRLFIGAEIASSPLPAINDIGPIAVICDFGNNRGMLIGPEIPDWQMSTAASASVTTWIDGERIAAKSNFDFADLARGSRDFLFRHGADRGITIPEGTYVSTGAVTGVHEAPIGAKSTLDFGRFGTVDLELTRALAESR